MKNWKLGIVLSIIVIVAVLGFEHFYKIAQGPIEASIAVNQVEDSDVAYVKAKAIAHDQIILKGVDFLGVTLLFLIWVPILINLIKKYIDAKKEGGTNETSS